MESQQSQNTGDDVGWIKVCQEFFAKKSSTTTTAANYNNNMKVEQQHGESEQFRQHARQEQQHNGI